MVTQLYPHIHESIKREGWYGFLRSQATPAKLKTVGYFWNTFWEIVTSQEKYNSHRLREYIVSIVLEIIIERFKYTTDTNWTYMVWLTPMKIDLLNGYDFVVGRHETTRLNWARNQYVAIDCTESFSAFESKRNRKHPQVSLNHFTHPHQVPLYILYIKREFVQNILDWTEDSLRENHKNSNIPLKSHIGFSLHKHLISKWCQEEVFQLAKRGDGLNGWISHFFGNLGRIRTVWDLKQFFSKRT